MGSMANMAVAPGGALGLGMLAGVWSVVGYVHIGPVLESKIGLQVGTDAIHVTGQCLLACLDRVGLHVWHLIANTVRASQAC